MPDTAIFENEEHALQKMGRDKSPARMTNYKSFIQAGAPASSD
jgi:hypothetical protein